MKRTRRLASLCSLLLSPALGGTLLPAVHPCPVDAPWMGQHSAEDHAGHEGHHSAPAPNPDSPSHDCTCISTCSTGPALAPPVLLDPVCDLAGLTVGAERPGSDAALLLSPTAERLPPATAPPLA